MDIHARHRARGVLGQISRVSDQRVLGGVHGDPLFPLVRARGPARRGCVFARRRVSRDCVFVSAVGRDRAVRWLSRRASRRRVSRLARFVVGRHAVRRVRCGGDVSKRHRARPDALPARRLRASRVRARGFRRVRHRAVRRGEGVRVAGGQRGDPGDVRGVRSGRRRRARRRAAPKKEHKRVATSRGGERRDGLDRRHDPNVRTTFFLLGLDASVAVERHETGPGRR
mmetsp:Transcript_4247/g.16912  ORF Transcript_4247/g.16912 Transcript_4247/m.16912 type:complete len:227 (+) Transcript_4247:1089-1769(+)